MLELIFQGFIEWTYGLVLEAWEFFSSALLDIMSMDFDYLRSHVPVIDTISEVMLAAGWAILIGNLVFQAVKSMMSGLGFEGEDPKLLFTRTFVFAFLLLASPQICNICLDMTSSIMELMEMPDAVNITLAEEATFGGLAVAWLLVVICGIIVMFQSFKLIFEMAERYFILAMLTICSPLAFGTGGSRNTSDLFSGWCRMYGSMCLLMVLHVVFVKMLLSVLSYCPSGLDVLPWMVLVLTIVKVAKKADALSARIGLNPAMTGVSLGRSFPGALTYAIVHSAASQVTKSMGKSGGGRKGGTSGAPAGGSGGPKPAGPTAGGGRSAAASGTAGTSTSHAQTANTQNQTQQVNNQQNASHSASQTQTATQQHGATQGIQQGGVVLQSGSQQSNSAQSKVQQSASSMSQIGAGSPSSTSQKSNTVSGPSSRNSSVPPGTRRAPSHVKVASMSPAADKPGVSGSQKPAAPAGTPSGGNSVTNQSETVKNGTAGTVSAPTATRISHVAAPTIRSGAVGSTVQAAEQNNVSVGSVHGSAPQSASKVSSGPGSQPAGSTRFSRREPSQSAVPRAVTPSVATPAASSKAPAPNNMPTPATPAASKQPQQPTMVQNGVAGMGIFSADRSAPKETRYSRNPTSVSQAAATGEARPSGATARQESRSVPSPASPIVSKRDVPHPGMAGTASAESRVSQARQTALNQTVQSKTTPLATDTLGAKRTVSNASGARKVQQSRKSKIKRQMQDGGGSGV
ncbi:MAG: hypothetical protein J6K03_06755 [Oscillospiraceae bacterium]|nr:hypothetical protein [Oscillospiraceae bacterium]